MAVTSACPAAAPCVQARAPPRSLMGRCRVRWCAVRHRSAGHVRQDASALAQFGHQSAARPRPGRVRQGSSAPLGGGIGVPGNRPAPIDALGSVGSRDPHPQGNRAWHGPRVCGGHMHWSASTGRGCSSAISKRGAPGFAASCTCDVLGWRLPRPARSRATRGARIQATVEGRQGAMAGLPRPSPAASRLAGLNRRGRSQKEPLRSAVASARAGAGRPLLAAAGRVGGSSGRCDHRASPPRGLRCEWSPGGGR